MAFSKSTPSPFGLDATYWRLDLWGYERRDPGVVVVVGSLSGFIDAETCAAGKKPFGTLPFELLLPKDATPETFGRAAIYDALKAYVFLGDAAPLFADAVAA